jgi:hypothetical protein
MRLLASNIGPSPSTISREISHNGEGTKTIKPLSQKLLCLKNANDKAIAG